MKKLPFILTFCTFLLGVKGQECKDSVVQLLFLGNNYPNGATPYFLSKTIADKNNNIYFNWPQPIFTDVINELTFFKINNEGKLIEKKIFTNNEVYGGPSFINSRNELVYTGFDRLNQNEPNKCNQLKLLCLDSSGTIKWEKKYLNNTGFFFGSNSAIAGKNDEIILAADGSNNICSNTALQKDYFLYKFSRTGALLMSKRYEITNLNLIGNNSYYIQSNVQLTGTEILMAGGFTYNEINQDQLKDAFFLSKIDYTSGKLLLTKAFTFTNNTQNPYRFHLKHIHYDSKTRQIVIVARAMAYEPSFFLLLLDENFNIIKTKRLLSGEPEASSNWNHIEVIRNDNTIAICNPQIKDTSITYTIINNQLEIIKQQKIKLSSYYGFYSEFGFSPFFDNFGNLRIRVANLFSTHNRLLLLNAPNNYREQAICYAYDTIYYNAEDAFAKEIHVSLWSEDLPPLGVSDQPLTTAMEVPIQTLEVCKKISVCSTIKISGQKTYCLPDSTGMFTVKINNECIRNIVWNFDTTAFRVKKMTDDTLIQLQFLKPYKGYIIASLNGCELRDSIAVEITNPSTACNLGNDTFFCPNSNQVLSSGNGYKSYQWQDGAVSSSYTVTKPGTYWLRVTDSCDNVSTDTVHILPQPYNWQLPSVVSICKEDSAAVWLNPFFTKPEITPPQTWALQKDSIIFFPLQTTVYHLEAVSTPGCKLYNTITITVNNCPVSIHFPNAFSPNNDGLNDLFKPIIEGVITDFDFKIFNRWGQLVFTTTRFTEGWNGVFKGSLQPAGNYTWTCRYRFKNKKPVFKKGGVLLIN